jgi:hypothetical protein
VHQPFWTKAPPPTLALATAPTQRWQLWTPSELTLVRMDLRDEILTPDGPSTATEDDADRLLLAFEELASNGLRHGRAPIEVVLTTATDGWLLDVSDTATDRAPTPAMDRDPAQGGFGLHLVARLSTAHGWFAEAHCKHVWAFITRHPVQSSAR